jgi:hypothetical protein
MMGSVILATSQPYPGWGLDRIDQATGLDNTYNYANDGSGVTIYILDEGIRASHNEFGGRVRFGAEFLSQVGTPNPPDPPPPLASITDCDGHGTQVAGIAAGSTYGVAKGASIVDVVVGAGCMNYPTDMANGINWVIDDHASHGGAAVLNISIAGPTDGSVPYQAGMEDAVRSAVAAGITVVVSAGNNNADAGGYAPARVPEAITVSATADSDGQRWVSSGTLGANFGAAVDLFAPGLDVLTAQASSDSAIGPFGRTSAAAPYVAGVAARYLQLQMQRYNYVASPAEVQQALKDNATFGVVNDAGPGSPNAFVYSGFIDPLVPGPGPSGSWSSDSAVRNCANYVEWAPVYEPNRDVCGDYCQQNGANACEWDGSNGNCYAEFGDGCEVQSGYSGWSAWVLNSGGGTGGSGDGQMHQNMAVRNCSSYSEWSPVYQPDADACRSYCVQNGADMCEWEISTGNCYAEFGGGCSLEGMGGWYAAILHGEEALAPAPDRAPVLFSMMAPARDKAAGMTVGMPAVLVCTLLAVWAFAGAPRRARPAEPRRWRWVL